MVQFSENEKAEFDDIKDKIIIELGEDTSLQEERRKTGKALATGIVIFLVCLGLYHAAVYGSARLSALVGGFIIMFLYVVSLLYSSHRKKKLSKSNEIALEREIEEAIFSAKKLQEGDVEKQDQKDEPGPPDRPRFVRTYSIA